MKEMLESEAGSLAARLDDLMMRLDQEGREQDVQLVRDAIAALPKPTVVGTPWTTPLKGDKCVRTDGKSREAVTVKYQRDWAAPCGLPMTASQPTPHYHASLIDFRDQKGREDTISASSWATWCRAAWRSGGTYTRAEEAR